MREVHATLEQAKSNQDARARLDGHLFDPVTQEVLKLMSQGAFLRFKKSEPFREFVQELGLHPYLSVTL